MPDKLTLLPDQTSYVYSTRDDVVQSEVESGFPRTRRDTTEPVGVVDCQWSVDDGEYQYIRAFFTAKALRGAAVFLCDLLLEQPEPEEHECVLVKNSFKTRRVRGLSFIVSAQLYVKPTLSVENAELLLVLFEQDSQKYFNALEKLVNVDLPRMSE